MTFSSNHAAIVEELGSMYSRWRENHEVRSDLYLKVLDQGKLIYAAGGDRLIFAVINQFEDRFDVDGAQWLHRRWTGIGSI